MRLTSALILALIATSILVLIDGIRGQVASYDTPPDLTITTDISVMINDENPTFYED